MTGYIDVQQHMIPADYARWLREHGVHAPGGRELPEWSPALALELMDRQGIAAAILSASPAALPSLLAFAKPGHVLYASDWPFVPELAVSYFNGHLRNSDQDTTAIGHRNAHLLFSRLSEARR
ncbi:hypothetical protein GCM10022419_125550 [Nonomuraea rosea]|uniref:Amidohydrolase-related domain-containing protein n=1 Tax=Nonomuraea rosea TaxID=638574 RepID=A0ABP6ZVU6_9ACTN